VTLKLDDEYLFSFHSGTGQTRHTLLNHLLCNQRAALLLRESLLVKVKTFGLADPRYKSARHHSGGLP
jgi:2-hydroxychromene-2-carboxylate isomerase